MHVATWLKGLPDGSNQFAHPPVPGFQFPPKSSPFRSQNPAHDPALKLVSESSVPLITLIFRVDSMDPFADTERQFRSRGDKEVVRRDVDHREWSTY